MSFCEPLQRLTWTLPHHRRALALMVFKGALRKVSLFHFIFTDVLIMSHEQENNGTQYGNKGWTFFKNALGLHKTTRDWF